MGREYDLTWLGAELIAQLASAVVDRRLLAAPAIRQLGCTSTITNTMLNKYKDNTT